MRKYWIAVVLSLLLFSFADRAHAMEPTEQPPFTKAELEKFLTDYPNFTEWLTKKNAQFDTLRSPWLMAGMRYDKEFTARLQEKGWDADRFFYLLNHIHTGLLLNASEQMQSEAEARMAQEQKENQTQVEKQRQEMQQEMEASRRWVREQQAAQRAEIMANPTIPPYQKQQMLAMLEQNSGGEEDALAGQMRWLDAQVRSIRNDPYMHPMQRQRALAQIEQARRSMQQAAKSVPADDRASRFRSQEAMESEMQAQQRQWFSKQKQSLHVNPMIHPMQKKQMLDQLDKAEKQFTASMEQKPRSIIPQNEKSLIEANQKKLMELFFNNP